MTHYRNLMLAAAGFMVASATPVMAREAQMLDFTAPDQISQGPMRAVPLINAQQTNAGSTSEITDPPDVAPISAPDVIVPSWMRRKGASLLTGPTPIIAANSLPRCQAPSYKPNFRLSLEAERRRIQLYPLVMAVACEAGVPGHLFDALVAQESRYNSAAVSPKGAGGLTQLMPETAVMLGVSNRFDIMQNLRGGARYLRSQLDEFGRYDLALGAYNAGPARIRRYRALPPFRETISYVNTILSDVRAALTAPLGYAQVAIHPRSRTASFMAF